MTNATVPLKLSQIKPDFESILLQLQLYLKSKDTWKDLLTSSTGETLLECSAAIGTFNQFAVESAVRESFLQARRASSIYAITRMLGVRIHRNNPASVGIVLKRKTVDASTVIPKFTRFDVNGRSFFNRYPIMFTKGFDVASERVYIGLAQTQDDNRYLRFNAVNLGVPLNDGEAVTMLVGNNTDVIVATYNQAYARLELNPARNLNAGKFTLLRNNVNLYSGEVKVVNFVADTTTFREIALPATNFTVSDVDVQTVVINPSTGERVLWTPTDEGIWIHSAADTVYMDATSGDGQCILSFGDNYHGKMPTLGSTLEFTYVVTQGADDNLGISGLEVKCLDFPTLEGTTNTVISGGANKKDASFYRALAPYIFKARRRAITGDDYLATTVDYPGIASASIQGQRDIAPHDLRWMNVIRICALPMDVSRNTLTAIEWSDYELYMKKRMHDLIHIQRYAPTEIECEVELILALFKQYTPSSVLPEAERLVLSLFDRRHDTLGRRIAASDVSGAAKVEGVDYIEAIKIKFISSGDEMVVDLIPPDVLHFVSLKASALTINTRYSERVQYLDNSVVE